MTPAATGGKSTVASQGRQDPQDSGHLSRCWLRAEVREWVVDQRMPNSPVSSRKSRQK